MTTTLHPADALFQGESTLPLLPAVDHYAGNAKLICKALSLQEELGPIFDVTGDCEDGAHAGAEAEHARMVAELVSSSENRYRRMGARIHDITHPHWRQDLEILVSLAGQDLAFLTFPKARSALDVEHLLLALRDAEARHGIERKIPAHFLIETHGALRDVWEIAALDGIESLDFGLMDFVSAHHGAIPASAMRSPGQFSHPLIRRAKTEISAAALAHGIVPSHNVTTELQDRGRIQADAEQARKEFGYLRMWSIHPNQIEPILAAMRPDFSETEESCEILCAAQDAAWGPIRHGARLHDRASFRYYWELLQRAVSTGVEIPTAARNRFFATDSKPKKPELKL